MVYNNSPQSSRERTLLTRRRKALPPLPPQLPEAGAIIGYARVSTAEQVLQLQTDALERAGCHRIVTEKVSAVSSRRPELEKALQLLRPGDVFVVWKLDRIARSLLDLKRRVEYIEKCGATLRCITQDINTGTPAGRLLLNILGTVAEFERDLIAERTRAGMKSARDRGVVLGRDPVMTIGQRKEAQKLRNGGMSLRLLAVRYGVSMGTIQNWTSRPKRR